MLFEPPVEEMVEKVGNGYLLANLMAKRGKMLFQHPTEELVSGKKTELQVAAEEIYSGKVSIEPKE